MAVRTPSLFHDSFLPRVLVPIHPISLSTQPRPRSHSQDPCSRYQAVADADRGTSTTLALDDDDTGLTTAYMPSTPLITVPPPPAP